MLNTLLSGLSWKVSHAQWYFCQRETECSFVSCSLLWLLVILESSVSQQAGKISIISKPLIVSCVVLVAFTSLFALFTLLLIFLYNGFAPASSALPVTICY